MPVIRISVDAPKLPLDGSIEHIATSWELYRSTDFENETYLVETSFNDVNKLVAYDYNIVSADPLYCRIKFHFNNELESNWSKILIVRPDQTSTGVDYANIVYTPLLEIGVNTEIILNTDLVIEMGETMVITNILQYTNVIIRGSTFENSGVLVWNNDGIITEYRYNDLLVTHTNQILDSMEYNSVTILADSTMSVNAVSSNHIVISSSSFGMYSGTAEHVATTWIVEDSSNKEVFIFENDLTNLKTLVIGLDTLTPDTLYIIKAAHIASTGIMSEFGKILFKTTGVNTEQFSATMVDVFRSNQNIKLNTLLYQDGFISANVIVMDENENIIANKLEQTVKPFNIDLPNLDINKEYKVKLKVLFSDGINSAYETVFTGKPAVNNIITRNQYTKYLDKFNLTQNINLLGQMIQSSTELSDGSILLSKYGDNALYRNELFRGMLTEIEPAILLDNENSVIDIEYVNVIPIDNTRVLIDYSSVRKVHSGSSMYKSGMVTDDDLIVVMDGANEVYYRPRFVMYEYNTYSKQFTYLRHIIRDDELYGTANNNSLVVIGNKAYYVPTHRVTGLNDNTKIDLVVKSLDLTTFEIDTVAMLPEARILSYVNINVSGDNNLIIFGGSGDLYLNNANDIVADRINYNVYTYDLTNNIWTIVGTLPLSTMPLEMYSLSSYVRKDNNIVIFNNVDSGATLANQDTHVLNIKTLEIEHFSNDVPDSISYRNTVSLNNGDFLRISSRALDPQLVYTYVSDTYNMGELVNDMITDAVTSLVIAQGNTVFTENPYQFTSIDILGTDTSNTGIFRWLDNNIVKEYNYTDLLITNDRIIEATSRYDSITILPNTTLTIV